MIDVDLEQKRKRATAAAKSIFGYDEIERLTMTTNDLTVFAQNNSYLDMETLINACNRA